MSNEAEQMTKDKKQQTLVPKLRFPEFRDYQAWTVDRLGNLFIERQETGNEELPLLSLTDKEGLIPQKDSGRKDNSNVNKSKYLRVDVGDIAYNTMRMWEGRSALAKNEGLVSPAYTVCVPTDRVDSRFFSYYFKTGHLIREFRRYSQGLVKDTLSLKYEVFSRIHVFFPGLREQQKIADCLGSLDDLIAAEGRKLAALRDHKKGLMQQLFPREGETRPRLRFPEFQDTPDWNMIPLAELLVRDPEYGVNASAAPYSEDLPAYIRITDIDDDGRYLSEGRVSVDIEATEDEYLQEGDIVLARTGASVGKSYRYRSEDGLLVFAGFLIRVRPKPTKLDSRFLAAYFSTGRYWDWVRITSARSGQPGINGSEYASMPLPVPPDDDSKGEQSRIANCLSALDDLIAAQVEKLDALRTHKRGLMQQLFPAPEGHQ